MNEDDEILRKSRKDTIGLFTSILILIIAMFGSTFYLYFNYRSMNKSSEKGPVEDDYNSIINREYKLKGLHEIIYYDSKDTYIITGINTENYELTYVFINESDHSDSIRYKVDKDDIEKIISDIKKYNIPEWEEMRNYYKKDDVLAVGLVFNYVGDENSKSTYMVDTLINYPNGGYDILDNLVKKIKDLKKESNRLIEGEIIYEEVI